jgi:hypothetical protein
MSNIDDTTIGTGFYINDDAFDFRVKKSKPVATPKPEQQNTEPPFYELTVVLSGYSRDDVIEALRSIQCNNGVLFNVIKEAGA